MLTNEELMAINGYSEDDLEHYGILGMKWGIRRYENPDGSLTEAGKRRYAKYERKKQRVMQSGDAKKILKFRKNLTDEEFDTAMARVAKTDALRYNANAAKREKQEARAEAKAERKAEKAAKEQAKLSKKQMVDAKKIAEQNAKQSIKSRDFVSTLTKAAAITGTIYTLYKNVSGIAGAAGIDISPANVTKLFKKKEENKGNNIDISELNKGFNTEAFKAMSDRAQSKQKPQQTNKTVWNMPAAGNSKSQNTDRINSFFSNMNRVSNQTAGDRNTMKIDEFFTNRRGDQFNRIQNEIKAKTNAGNTEKINSFFSNLSSGQKTTSSILSGTVEGTGNSFKSLPYNSLSNLPRETFVKTDNFINAYKSQPILLDYDRSK